MSNTKKYKAILFDFDGVIGQTMEDNYRAWKHAFSYYGINIGKEEYFLLEGFNTKKIAEHFLEKSRKSTELANEVIGLKEKFYKENSKFLLYDGVKSLICQFKKKGYLLALVSGGSHARISKSLSKEFLGNFNVIITGDKVNNCKPHPEPYLNAAKILSVEPSECVVIENAPLGIESAKGAGMDCIAISSTLDRKYFKKADRVINKFIELEGIL